MQDFCPQSSILNVTFLWFFLNDSISLFFKGFFHGFVYFHPAKQSSEPQNPREKLVVEKAFHFDLAQKDPSLPRPEPVRLGLQCTH